MQKNKNSLKNRKRRNKKWKGRKINTQQIRSLGEKERLKTYKEIKCESEGFGRSKAIRTCEGIKG